MGEPMAEAPAAPLGQVIFADGVAGKPAGEDGLNLGLLVEPLNHHCAGFTVQQAVVDRIADGLGKAGDFADPGDLRVGWIVGRGRIRA